MYKSSETFVFKCDSYNPITTTWYFNQKKKYPKNVNIVKGEDNKLFIVSSAKKNEGFYECIGTTHLNKGLFSATAIIKRPGIV